MAADDGCGRGGCGRVRYICIYISREGWGGLARVTNDAATAEGGGGQAGKEEGRGRKGGKIGEGKERKGKGGRGGW